MQVAADMFDRLNDEERARVHAVTQLVWLDPEAGTLRCGGPSRQFEAAGALIIYRWFTEPAKMVIICYVEVSL
ncbi:hypothetical protein [Streptomyces sp. NPDC001436]